MKQLLPLFFILASITLNAQDMQKYLRETKEIIQQGKYKEALERCIWFHEHALEKDPGMKGVRLSFALSDWKSLADVYPPAMKSLVEIRDAKTLKIVSNEGAPELFSEVQAINRTIGENAKTVSLFESVYLRNPDEAKTYWRYAKEDLFAAKRYDLIGKFIGNPMREYSVLVENLDRDIAMSKTMEKNEALLKAYAENAFVEKSIQLIQFAIASDDLKTAKAIQQAALKMVVDYRLNNAIPG
jgi:hypothetical protein